MHWHSGPGPPSMDSALSKEMQTAVGDWASVDTNGKVQGGLCPDRPVTPTLSHPDVAENCF